MQIGLVQDLFLSCGSRLPSHTEEVDGDDHEIENGHPDSRIHIPGAVPEVQGDGSSHDLDGQCDQPLHSITS